VSCWTVYCGIRYARKRGSAQTCALSARRTLPCLAVIWLRVASESSELTSWLHGAAIAHLRLDNSGHTQVSHSLARAHAHNIFSIGRTHIFNQVSIMPIAARSRSASQLSVTNGMRVECAYSFSSMASMRQCRSLATRPWLCVLDWSHCRLQRYSPDMIRSLKTGRKLLCLRSSKIRHRYIDSII
jgi:hypothetical protein